ncbi:SLAP domain-containing protein [Companilactobacillus nuruki]|uniref:S-layer protein C-terminal domain-containing protein n=1 Tax=Companilactobacillus nuruki TaxID=1993540 RepID=A0A2N7AUZ7_9LACO|nr:SLAP domain-containing protein [Companilactobacillus nuruki]PMD71443.1 hypothetical protein CBP76_05540 [Companilactobacillus nuruki]
MNKNKVLLASTLAILIAPTVLGNISNTATPVQAATSNLTGTVRRGGAVLYDNNGNMIPNSSLGNYTSWKLGSSFTKNGTTYYEVATNQYVDADSVSIDDGTTLLNPTTNDTGLEAVNPVATIQNGGGTVYDANGYATNRVLPNGSSWKIANIATINGERYLQVGGNEYIKEAGATQSDDNIPQTNSSTATNTSTPSSTNRVGMIMGGDTAVVDANGKSTGITLPNLSSWQLGQDVLTINGTNYYQVATNEYVPVSSVHVQGTNDYQPSTPAENGQANPISTTITLINSSQVLDDNGNDTGKTLPAGSSWHADQSKVMHNYVYYRVATNEWISNGGFYGNTDIFGNGPATVTLATAVQLYDSSTNSYTRSLPKASSWKVSSSVQNYNNQIFVQVSKNEWIPLPKDPNKSIFVVYSADSSLYASFAYAATYEPDFAKNPVY